MVMRSTPPLDSSLLPYGKDKFRWNDIWELILRQAQDEGGSLPLEGLRFAGRMSGRYVSRKNREGAKLLLRRLLPSGYGDTLARCPVREKGRDFKAVSTRTAVLDKKSVSKNINGLLSPEVCGVISINRIHIRHCFKESA